MLDIYIMFEYNIHMMNMNRKYFENFVAIISIKI